MLNLQTPLVTPGATRGLLFVTLGVRSGRRFVPTDYLCYPNARYSSSSPYDYYYYSKLNITKPEQLVQYSASK